jgi:hypothetical protein
MGFKGTPETERAIEQTVEAILACPGGQAGLKTLERLIRKLRGLWLRRLCKIAARPLASTPSIRTTGPTPATAASSIAPTESATATTSTAAATSTAAPEPTFP